MINVKKLQKLFDVDDAKLRSVKYIEECIWEAGLRPLRGDNRPYEDRDDKLAMIQEPMQLTKLAVYLSHFDIRSYLELGVASGSTFLFLTHYMREMCGLKEAFAIDIVTPSKLMPVLDSGMMLWAEFYKMNSQDVEFKEFLDGREFDLAFIDGSHEYADVMNDYRLLKKRARILVFHDIVCRYQPGVVKAWSLIREENPNCRAVEFIDQSHDRPVHVAGIGLIHMAD